MTNTMISLNILSSYCWIDKNSLNHAKCSDTLVALSDLDDIALKQIPPIKRRRLNGLSKMAMHASLSCLEQVNVKPDEVLTVFASQHGELSRTVTIVSDLVQGEEISPKDFSLSVHNASLGLFSIFNHNKNPGTSIAANSNTFGFALLESYNILKRNPNKKVLLTCFDMQVSQPFDQLQAKAEPSYSLSLLLSLEEGQKVSLSFERTLPTSTTAPLKTNTPLALCFFEFLRSDETLQQLNSSDTRWEFSKHAV